MSADDKQPTFFAETTTTTTNEKELAVNAQLGAQEQHELTVKDSFRLYRPAIAWSFLFSLGVIM